MKRFIGLVLAVAGGALTLWGGYQVITGQSGSRVTLADGFSVTSLTAGLAGLAVLTLGLVWARD